MGKLYLGTQEIGAAYSPTTPDAYMPLEVTGQGALRKPSTSFTWSVPSTATSIDSYGLYYVFYGCAGLTSVDLSSITSISSRGLYYTFCDCTSLASVDLSSVASIGSSGLFNTFRGCTSLSTLRFPALTTTSFGTSTNQFNNMLSGCSGVTVHFPAAIQSTIGSWSSVTSGFGGTNTTVLFDL